jgi:hypothetical protein
MFVAGRHSKVEAPEERNVYMPLLRSLPVMNRRRLQTSGPDGAMHPEQTLSERIKL